MNSFNPLPLPKQGEMREDSNPHPSVYRFQSAPLTEARGDEYVDAIAAANTLFQSAPLTEARGDLRVPWPAHLFQRFNPLPLPKQGEIRIFRA